MIDYRSYRAHRLAWLYVYGEMPESQVDHINGIRDDNRIANLRLATSSENMFNTGLSPKNSSGYKGVHQQKSTGKWIASARINGKRIVLGSFLTAEEASMAYKQFAKERHGSFYRE